MAHRKELVTWISVLGRVILSAIQLLTTMLQTVEHAIRARTGRNFHRRFSYDYDNVQHVFYDAVFTCDFLAVLRIALSQIPSKF